MKNFHGRCFVTEFSSTDRDIKQIETMIRYCRSIEDAVRIFGADREDFLSNEQYQNSCAFSLIQIGERIKRISKELTSKYDTIEWKDLAGFRDVLSHGYGGVNLNIVWETITTEIPVIKKECETILADLKKDGPC